MILNTDSPIYSEHIWLDGRRYTLTFTLTLDTPSADRASCAPDYPLYEDKDLDDET